MNTAVKENLYQLNIIRVVALGAEFLALILLTFFFEVILPTTVLSYVLIFYGIVITVVAYRLSQADKISESEFADNAGKYINQKITVKGWFTAAIQPGSYKSDLTLRMNGDNAENINSVYHYYFTLSDGAKDFYCRRIEIGGNKVVLKIPKENSNQMPRITNGYIKLTGIVKRYNEIEIIKISRNK